MAFFSINKNTVDFYTSKIKKLSADFYEKKYQLREKTAKNHKSIILAAFVSFKTHWETAVCVQTPQSRNPTVCLTDFKPDYCLFLRE